MARNPLNIKFNFRMNAQTGASKLVPARKIEEWAQRVVEDVAFETAKNYSASPQIAGIQDAIEGILLQEVAVFARAMANGIVGRPDGSLGPSGILSTTGGGVPFNVGALGIDWGARSPKYLERKAKLPRTGRGHTRWFEYDFELDSFLRSPEALIASLGPIRAVFTPQVKAFKGGFLRNQLGQFESGGLDQAKKTFPGNPGRPLSNPENIKIQVGRLAVSVFGNITPAMLPSLLTGDPHDYLNGQASGLNALLPRNIAKRLDGPNLSMHRMTIEPYLSWFLSRAIPYAVSRRVAQTLGSRNAYA